MFIQGLFPIPLGHYNLDRNLNLEEINFIKDSYKNKKSIGTNNVSTDSYILNNPSMILIKEFIESCLDLFLQEVDPISENSKIYITQSWLTFTDSGQSHHVHNHPNSYLSGVLYLEVDPKEDKLYFVNPHIRDLVVTKKQYTAFNSDEWSIPVTNGKLIIFPSNINHYVKEYNKDKTRISLAFNTFIKGILGSEELLTELKL